MGISASAVLLYGFPIPQDHQYAAYRFENEEALDVILKRHHGVGHASAGPYDQNTRYIVTDFHEAECGRYSVASQLVIPTFSERDTAQRNVKLETAAMRLGLTDHPAPAWYLIANQY